MIKYLIKNIKKKLIKKTEKQNFLIKYNDSKKGYILNKILINYKYIYLWMIFILLMLYIFQTQVLIYFFPDLVINQLELYFNNHVPFSMNNQIYFIIEDKLNNIQYVQDNGYFFNLIKDQGSLLNNYNLFYITYNAFMRKAQYIGYDKANENKDNVKYKYNTINHINQKDLFDKINNNYLYEIDEYKVKSSYQTFRLYLNFIRQGALPFDDTTVSGLTDFLGNYTYNQTLTISNRLSNENILTSNIQNNEYQYISSFLKMYTYLNKSKGSYIGSKNKNFFSWLYDKYISSIYIDKMYKNFFIKKKLDKKYFNIEYLDSQLLKKKKYLPNIYPNFNYSIEEEQKREILRIKKKEYYYFFLDFYNFFIKINLNILLKNQLTDFYFYNKLKEIYDVNIMNRTNENKINDFYFIKKTRNEVNEDEYFYKNLIKKQQYLYDRLIKENNHNFYKKYKNEFLLPNLNTLTKENNAFQDDDDSLKFIPTSVTSEYLDDELYESQAKLQLLEAETSNELLNYHHLKQEYIDNIFLKLYPRNTLLYLNPRQSLNYFHEFNNNYLYRLNTIDFKVLQYFSFLEENLKEKDKLIKNFNFLNEFLQLNSFYSLYKKIELYEKISYEFFFANKLTEKERIKYQKLENIDINFENFYKILNKYYLYYHLDQLYDYSNISELDNKWEDFGISPIDLYVKKTNYKYKLLETEKIREIAREYLKNQILIRYLWNLEYKNMLYFYMKEKYLRPFLFEGYSLKQTSDDLYANLFLNYMGHSYRLLHRKIANNLEFNLFNYDSKVKELHNDVYSLYLLFLNKKMIDKYVAKMTNKINYLFNIDYEHFYLKDIYNIHRTVWFSHWFHNMLYYKLLKRKPIDLDTPHLEYYISYFDLIKKQNIINFTSYRVLDKIDIYEYFYRRNLEYYDEDTYKEYYRISNKYYLYILKYYFNKLYHKIYKPKYIQQMHEQEYYHFFKTFRLKYYSPFLWDRYSDNIFLENDLRFSTELYKIFGIDMNKGYLNKLRGLSYWDAYIYNDKMIDGYIFNINKKFSKNMIKLSKKYKTRLFPIITSLETENLKTVENFITSYYLKKKHYMKKKNRYFKGKKVIKKIMDYDNRIYDDIRYKKRDMYELYYKNKKIRHFKNKHLKNKEFEKFLETLLVSNKVKNKYRRDRIKEKKKAPKMQRIMGRPYYIKKYYNIGVKALVEKGFIKKTKQIPIKKKRFKKILNYIYSLPKFYRRRRKGTASKYDNSWNLYNSYYFDELRLYEKPIMKNLLSIFYKRRLPTKKHLMGFVAGQNDIDNKKYKLINTFQILSEKPYSIQTRTTKMLPLFIRYIYRKKNYKFIVFQKKKDDFLKNYFILRRDFFTWPLFYKYLMILPEIKNALKLDLLINNKETKMMEKFEFIYLSFSLYYLAIINLLFKFFYYLIKLINLFFNTKLLDKLNNKYQKYYKKYYYDLFQRTFYTSTKRKKRRFIRFPLLFPRFNFVRWKDFKQYKQFSNYPFDTVKITFYQKYKFFFASFLFYLAIVLIGEKMIKYLNIYFTISDNNTDWNLDFILLNLCVGYVFYFTAFYLLFPTLDTYFKNIPYSRLY